MSFIVKNPIMAPSISNPPKSPPAGFRGLYPGNDGWYEIDSNGNTQKIGSGGGSPGTGGIQEKIYLTNGMVIESRSTGIYLVEENGHEEQLYSFEKGICASYADISAMADMASYDGNNNLINETYATKVYVQGLIDELNALREIVESLYTKSLVRTATITLVASAWNMDSDNQYSQVVDIAGITEYSKVDLQPTPEQLAIFHEKDVTFVTENEGGTVTVHCIGQKPANDYVIQATITEVEIDE